jgi:hypothetical protein
MTGERGAPNQARHIINLLGGRTVAADVLKWPQTKVDSCLRRGFVRCQDQRHVLESAWTVGVNMNALDFVVHLTGLHRPTAAAA